MSKKLMLGFITALLSFSMVGCGLDSIKETAGTIKNKVTKEEEVNKKEEVSKEDKPETKKEETSQTIKQNEKAFKALCKSYSYEELERYPQKYEGKPIQLEGMVLQAIENGDKVNLILDVTNNGDLASIDYTRQDKNEPRLLEDDKVKLWGEFQGVTAYETVLEHTLMIPSVQAAYIELKVEEKQVQEKQPIIQEKQVQEKQIPKEKPKSEAPVSTPPKQTVTTQQAKNNTYIISDSSSRYLTDSDLYNLSSYYLKLARNEIYARHGYIFETQEMKNYFNNQAWYIPTTPASQFSDSTLNNIETYNIDFIKKYENGEAYSAPASTNNTSASSYVIPYSSTRYLTESDLNGLSSYQLKIARNEIYARHGYIFVTDDMRNYFNSQSWYTPTISSNNFSDSMLSDIETYNIDFIKQHE